MSDASAPTQQNRLSEETSPYLLQHKDNPVHWQPWSEDTLALADRLQKPILLSVGYAACHWCHVMAHECFEDPEIADLMNRLFVSIKVDREERPDIDGIYQSALALLGEHGGWPLTMFLTPAGEPFWGGTYFPPAPRFGRPGFPQVLQGVADIYAGEPEKVEKNVSALTSGLQQLSQTEAGQSISLETITEIARRLVRPAGQPEAPLARLAAQRGRTLSTGGRVDANQDEPGRHLRPPRRWVFSILRRQPMVGASFRENAL
jgi:uncharacterized protein YyaL (SSP411 family)